MGAGGTFYSAGSQNWYGADFINSNTGYMLEVVEQLLRHQMVDLAG